jgi:hypothetical protein
MENLCQLLDTTVPDTAAFRTLLQGVSECQRAIPIEPCIFILIGPPSEAKTAVMSALAAVVPSHKRSDGSVFLPPDPSDPTGPIDSVNDRAIRALFIDHPGTTKWHAPTVWNILRYNEPFNITPRLCCTLRGHVIVCANDLSWLPTDHYDISKAIRFVYIEGNRRRLPTRLTIQPVQSIEECDTVNVPRAPRAEDARRHNSFG